MSASPTAVQLAKLVELARLCLQLGRVNRATCHEDGIRPESDTDHTVMLGIVGCAFAEQFAPELDRGLVAQFALVHDFVEAIAGDTVTLGAAPRDLAAKHQREAAALAQLAGEFAGVFPWLPAQIAAYESQASPEARFIKVLDKVLPPLTHLLNRGGALPRGLSPAELATLHAAQREKIAQTAGIDQPAACALLAAIHGQLAGAFGAGAVPC